MVLVTDSHIILCSCSKDNDTTSATDNKGIAKDIYICGYEKLKWVMMSPNNGNGIAEAIETET